MTSVLVQIIRFVVEKQPHFVECVMEDAFGQNWHFEAKASHFTNEALDAQSNYPQPGMLPCTIVREWNDDVGRHLVTIDTLTARALKATNGKTQFEVLRDAIKKAD